jgi:cobalt-zinc-cadmium efflux system outer membrane protein
MPYLASSPSFRPEWLRGSRRATQLLFVAGAVLIPGAARAQGDSSAESVQPQALSRAAATLTLRELLDSVRVGHPLVSAARARVRAARGTRTTAGTRENPVFALEVEGAPLPGRTAPTMDRQTMAMATLPLQSIYQRRPRVRRADAQVRAAEADAEATRQQVALDAAHAYYHTALAQVSVEAAQDVAAWLDTVVAYNRARVKEGVAAEADLIRSEVERDRASADATMQEADLARARADLVAFLGSGEHAELSVGRVPLVAVENAPLPLPRASGSDTVARASARPTGIGGRLLSQAATTRPQVIAAQERLVAAGASVTSERTMVVRELAATLGTMRMGGITSLVAGVSMPFPLFDQNRGEIARARAERDAAGYELAAAEREARAEVTGAYEAARLLTARTSTLSAAGADGVPLFLARADEARRIALGAYREGAVPLFTVIDAARTWGEARVAYYRTLFAQHESVLALLTVEGMDLTTTLPDGAAGAPR